MAIAILLYALDSTVLLYANEGILIAGRKSMWSATFGDGRLRFLGRSVCILSLFTPHKPAFRLGWKFGALADLGPDATPVLLSAPNELRALAPFTIGAGLALYGLLPLGLFADLGLSFIAAAAAMLYLNIFAALCLLYRCRHTLDLSGKKFAALAFECIACPPFAVNLVRRVTLAQRVAEQFTSAAQRLLDADAWHEVQAICAMRLDEAIEAEPAGSMRATTLQQQRQRFNQEASP